LTGFEVRAYFQAWLLYSNTCFRQNVPVTIPRLARATEEREGTGIDSRLEKTDVCFHQ